MIEHMNANAKNGSYYLSDAYYHAYYSTTGNHGTSLLRKGRTESWHRLPEEARLPGSLLALDKS